MFEQPTDKERILFGTLPEGIPLGLRTAGLEKIPVIKRAKVSDIPEKLLIFNSPKRFESPQNTGLHSFDHGPKNMTALTRPLSWIHKFVDFKCVVSPDSYMNPHLAPWQKARNTVLARAAGATWQDRGLTVIPSIRWSGEDDYELVASGIEQGSVFAVTADNTIQDGVGRKVFEKGLLAMIDLIEPEAVIVYRPITEAFSEMIAAKTLIATF